MNRQGKRLQEVYRCLSNRYGPRHWWPGDGPFEVCIGAILTQAAAWPNVEKAIANLKAARAFSPQGLRSLTHEELARLVYPCVYFNVKARKLKAFVEHLGRHYNDDLGVMLSKEAAALRQELLSIYGIGEETADDILLYAAGKPSFVIDAYTRRILGRLGLAPEKDSYRAYQALFHEHLTTDAQLYNEYHALLDHLGKEVCRKEPLCEQCCLLEVCPTGKSRLRGTHANA